MKHWELIDKTNSYSSINKFVNKHKKFMTEYFVPYNEAVELKELGFKEKCFGCYYTYVSENFKKGGIDYRGKLSIDYTSEDDYILNSDKNYYIAAPLYSQVFKWFREKYNLFCEITLDSYKEPYLLKISIKQLDESNTFISQTYRPDCIDGIDTFSNKEYKKAELSAVIKLIEIVKKQIIT